MEEQIKAIQGKLGADQDGEIGRNTLELIYEAVLGANGAAFLDEEKAKSIQGKLGLDEDGILGNDSVNAIYNFLFPKSSEVQSDSKILGKIKESTFLLNSDGSVSWSATHCEVDGDGTSFQDGEHSCYCPDDKNGLDFLENAKNGNKFVGVVTDSDGHPITTANGCYVSSTTLRYPGKELNDPNAYINTYVVPGIVLPPLVIKAVEQAVFGSKCSVTYKDKTVDGVCFDSGPRQGNSEISIGMAKALGIPSSPKNGGMDGETISYIVYPGLAAEGFTLMKANGTFVQ